MNLFFKVAVTWRLGFYTFTDALYTLYISSTGDSWTIPFYFTIVEDGSYVVPLMVH